MYSARTPSHWMIGPLALALSLAASAQTPAPNPPPTSPTSNAATGSTAKAATAASLSSSDRSFVEKAAAGGMAEVQLGQLASQKATDPQVKQFAERMINDHTKANDQLKKILEAKNASLPADIPAAEKREHDRLSKLSGADFDREYMNHMTSDHKEDVDLFRKAAKSAHDPELRQYASSTLPTLEQHLSMAQSIDKSTQSHTATKSMGSQSVAKSPQ